MHWASTLFVMALIVFLVGCGKGTFCRQCAEPKKPAVKIDWAGLSDELQKVDFGGDVTIRVENADIVLELGDNAWKVEVTNWSELAEQLRKIGNVNAAEVEHFALLHRLHAMLADRQAPKTYNFWLWGDHPFANQCPRELPTFVFFPHEAQLDAWMRRDYDKPCPSTHQKSTPVCASLSLYEDYVRRFRNALQNCPSDVTTLRVRGFASSSVIRATTDKEKGELRKKFDGLAEPHGRCERVSGPKDGPPELNDDDGEIFNLLVAEHRARNVKKMLEAADLGSISVEKAVWCSYGDMVEARRVVDRKDGEYDGVEGMLNRRVEIRVLPYGESTP